ncbi:MAG TPA: preprotein translocase subunit SecE [Ruminococcus sp.]|nr:preprotein translocase subunit SecE [Ruminococcus sp.]
MAKKENDEVSVKEEKSTKKTKESKKSAKDEGMKENGVAKWFHDLKVEFRNVTWPTRQTVATNTGVVLSVIVMGSVIIGLLDSGLLKLAQFLVGLAKG